jgi:hypothetical protein
MLWHQRKIPTIMSLENIRNCIGALVGKPDVSACVPATERRPLQMISQNVNFDALCLRLESDFFARTLGSI